MGTAVAVGPPMGQRKGNIIQQALCQNYVKDLVVLFICFCFTFLYVSFTLTLEIHNYIIILEYFLYPVIFFE